MTRRHQFARRALTATASIGALTLAVMAHDAAAQTTEDAAPPVHGSMLNWNDYLKEREARA